MFCNVLLSLHLRSRPSSPAVAAKARGIFDSCPAAEEAARKMFLGQGPVIPGRIRRPIVVEDGMARIGGEARRAIRLDEADIAFRPQRVEEGVVLGGLLESEIPFSCASAACRV